MSLFGWLNSGGAHHRHTQTHTTTSNGENVLKKEPNLLLLSLPSASPKKWRWGRRKDTTKKGLLCRPAQSVPIRASQHNTYTWAIFVCVLLVQEIRRRRNPTSTPTILTRHNFNWNLRIFLFRLKFESNRSTTFGWGVVCRPFSIFFFKFGQVCVCVNYTTSVFWLCVFSWVWIFWWFCWAA